MSLQSDTIRDHPHPGDDPAARLRHTLNICADAPDDRFVVQATHSIYSSGEITGLTMGDLRALAERLGV